MATLYPAVEPRVSGLMQANPLHTLYWEESGRADGIPVVFLHGGPGAGCSPRHRRFFDPAVYRIILFDQRGSGRSLPLGELCDNTTAHLIGDMERLRQHLGVERWLLFGGSWGSTLALAYAQAHPERCLGLVLRGIFLARPREIDWFMQGMGRVYPEAWETFAGYLPESCRADLLQAFYQRLTDPDPAIHMPAARVWSHYEGACSTLLPDPETLAHFADDTVALGLARIEAHYFVNRAFLGENELLNRVARLRGLPGIIVQGRYDMVCPLESAHALHQAWPEAEYCIVPDAGHAAWEPGNLSALVEATRRFGRSGHFRPCPS